MPERLTTVRIYTDGACSGNPGPGGYGALLVHDKRRKEISGGFRRTTNSRMEIMAAIAAIKTLKRPCRATLYSDSKYLVDSMRLGWARRWRANGWRRNKRDLAQNPDLWAELLDLCDQHEVEFVWVKGHADHPENQRCDDLAVGASQRTDLPPDEGYEDRNQP
ncbi:MAG: ribonuclease HI [Planctomycetes bacterium]|nr:ribonuclease HI [Planctomycetota bacterium]